MLQVTREISALDSLGLDTDNDTLIVQGDDVVLAAGAAMSDTEHLNVSLIAASFLDSLDDFGVVILDIPVLDADLFYLARMVDQVGKLVCGSLVFCHYFAPLHNPTLTDRFVLSILQSHGFERLISVALVEGIHTLQRRRHSGIHSLRLSKSAGLDLIARAASVLVGLFQKVGVFLIG